MGSEFAVTLPLASREEVLRVRKGEEQASAEKPRYRILVVDDNVDAADSLATLLRLLGQKAAQRGSVS